MRKKPKKVRELCGYLGEESVAKAKSQCKGPAVDEVLVQESQSEWCRETWQGWRVGVDRVIGDEIRAARINAKVSSSFP